MKDSEGSGSDRRRAARIPERCRVAFRAIRDIEAGIVEDLGNSRIRQQRLEPWRRPVGPVELHDVGAAVSG